MTSETNICFHNQEMYGLYKQALQDPPIEDAETPGMFDLKGKAKKRAWQVRFYFPTLLG